MPAASTPPAQWWLVRHTPPRVEAGVCYGRSNLAVNPTEVEALAQQLSACWSAQNVPTLVCSSVLQRCERLTSILQGLHANLTVEFFPGLQEMDFGCWEGRAWSELPVDELQAWTDDFAQYRCGGGESVAHFMARVAQAQAVAWAQAQALGCPRLVWVTHAGVIRALTLLRLGVDCPQQAELWPANAPGYGQWWCWTPAWADRHGAGVLVL